MNAYLFKKLILFVFFLLPVCVYANSSTDIVPRPVTNVLPNVLYTDDCVDAANIEATHIGIASIISTWGTKETMCPQGYVTRRMKVYVAVGLGSGESDWKFNCCRTRVTYDQE